MKFRFLEGWNIDNTIQSLVLLAAAISLYFLYKTLREGQKQTKQSNKLTKQSLSISQYHIFIEELKYFVERFQNLKFSVNPVALPGPEYNTDIQNANGIDDIKAFRPLIRPITYYFNADRTLNDTRSDEFRHNILFPLYRHYSQLYNFLERVKNDSLLKAEHKRLLYLLLERDLLQTYFRVTINEDPLRKKWYDLAIFDTAAFNSRSLYSICEFYTNNNLFALHTLDFYKETL